VNVFHVFLANIEQSGFDSNMASDSQYPKVTTGQNIDRQAKAVVDMLLAKDWLVHQIVEHDFGRDYLIESVVDGHPSGKMFHAQLKGSGSVEFDGNGRTGWSLETPHLRYYGDLVREPVFLFVIDVAAGQGWFCFVQEQLATTEAKVKLATQKSMRLELRLDQPLADRERLRGALDHALWFMREKNPGSLQAALRAAAAKQEAIDPNFAVIGAEVTDGNTCLRLAPKGPFSFSLRVPRKNVPAVVPRIEEMFQFGRSVELTTDEIEFEGLPTFTKAKDDGLRGHLIFTPGNALPCEVTISSDGRKHGFSLTFVGELTRGSEGGLVVAGVKDTPLGIELRLSLESLKAKKVAGIEFTWRLAAWVGKPLSTLSHIEPIVAFWNALAMGAPIRVSMTQSGNRLVRGKFRRKQMPAPYRALHELCRMLQKAREVAIARRFETRMQDGENLLKFDWDDIDVAHALVTTGVYKRPAPKLVLQMNPAADNTKFLDAFQGAEQIAGWSRVEMHPYTVTVFGEAWDLGDAVLEVGPATMHKVLIDGKPLAEIRGKEGTQLHIERGTPLESIDEA
jgi:hypothetical protein